MTQQHTQGYQPMHDTVIGVDPMSTSSQLTPSYPAPHDASPRYGPISIPSMNDPGIEIFAPAPSQDLQKPRILNALEKDSIRNDNYTAVSMGSDMFVRRDGPDTLTHQNQVVHKPPTGRIALSQTAPVPASPAHSAPIAHTSPAHSIATPFTQANSSMPSLREIQHHNPALQEIAGTSHGMSTTQIGPALQRTADEDELDVITRVMQPGAPAQPLVDAIKQELTQLQDGSVV